MQRSLTLPGTCISREYFCAARKCNTNFDKSLHLITSVCRNHSDKRTELFIIIKNTRKQCTPVTGGGHWVCGIGKLEKSSCGISVLRYSPNVRDVFVFYVLYSIWCFKVVSQQTTGCYLFRLNRTFPGCNSVRSRCQGEA